MAGRKMAPYQRVKRYVVDGIASGRWAAGERVPTEQALADKFGVSRLTVHRALRELSAEKRIVRRQGSGSFVGARNSFSVAVDIPEVSREVEGRGQRHSARVLELTRVAAEGEIARLLEIGEGGDAFRLRAIHLADGAPFQYEERLVNAGLIPSFIEQDFSTITSTAYLLSLSKPAQVEHAIEACAAPREVARALAIAEGAPVLTITRRTWRRSTIATWVRLWHPGGAYRVAGTMGAVPAEAMVS